MRLMFSPQVHVSTSFYPSQGTIRRTGHGFRSSIDPATHFLLRRTNNCGNVAIGRLPSCITCSFWACRRSLPSRFAGRRGGRTEGSGTGRRGREPLCPHPAYAARSTGRSLICTAHRVPRIRRARFSQVPDRRLASRISLFRSRSCRRLIVVIAASDRCLPQEIVREGPGYRIVLPGACVTRRAVVELLHEAGLGAHVGESGCRQQRQLRRQLW